MEKRNWELLIKNRFSGRMKKKNGRIVFSCKAEQVEEEGELIYKRHIGKCQRFIYKYEIK